MIEMLIKYIEDKGFTVAIIPKSEGMAAGVLSISKMFHGQKVSVEWMVASYDLHPDFQENLFTIADQYCSMIDKAISDRQRR